MFSLTLMPKASRYFHMKYSKMKCRPMSKIQVCLIDSKPIMLSMNITSYARQVCATSNLFCSLPYHLTCSFVDVG